jgi:hypothetical protein
VRETEEQDAKKKEADVLKNEQQNKKQEKKRELKGYSKDLKDLFTRPNAKDNDDITRL